MSSRMSGVVSLRPMPMRRPTRARSPAISARAGASCAAPSSPMPLAATPTLRSTQSGRILGRRALAPEEVAAVHARLSPFVAGMVGGRDASTMPAAQMSLPYAIAARICFGTAGLSAYSPERRADERLRGFIERVAIDLDESVLASDRASVAIVTRNGERIEEPTTTALGAPDNPVADRELLAKYHELASYALPKAQARALADAVMSLEGVPDARELLGLLAHSGANARRREQA